MSNYKTRLSKSIDLEVDEWEVGLAEIITHIPGKISMMGNILSNC